MLKRLRRTAAGTAAVLVLLTGAACGDSDGDGADDRSTQDGGGAGNQGGVGDPGMGGSNAGTGDEETTDSSIGTGTPRDETGDGDVDTEGDGS